MNINLDMLYICITGYNNLVLNIIYYYIYILHYKYIFLYFSI